MIDDMDNNSPSRRKFIHQAALLGAALGPLSAVAENAQTGVSITTANGTVPRRRLGKSDIEVAILGAAKDIVRHALDAGLNFFDNACEYHKGQNEEWPGAALGDRRKEAVSMTKVCTHGRDKKIAIQVLEESLRRPRTGHLDVWQIHEVIYDNDPDMIFPPNGAAEALAGKERRQGSAERVHGAQGPDDPSHNVDFPSTRCRCRSIPSMAPSAASPSTSCPKLGGKGSPCLE
jgi:hypothetical protein